MTIDDAVAGIAATITAQGLKCHPVRDGNHYPGAIQVPGTRMTYLEDHIIDRDGFHGEWNYAIAPAPRPAPGPGPGPQPEPARPGRVAQDILNHPALTGIPARDLTALATALQVPFGARREQRNYTRRGRRRVNTVRNGDGSNGHRRLDITDHLLALRLRQHLTLPVAAIGALLAVDPGTVSHAMTLAAELLAAARITLPDTPPPQNLPRTPAGLLSYAAAAGVPLSIPENGQQMPAQFKTRTSRTTRDTPETHN